MTANHIMVWTHSELLVRIAKDAYEQADAYAKTKGHQAPGESALKSTDTLVRAAVFSALALESFINELFCRAEILHDTGAQDDEIRLLCGLNKAVGEKVKSNTMGKFSLAYVALTGGAYNAGTLPFQNFEALIRLRHNLVHSVPRSVRTVVDGEATTEELKILDQLPSRLVKRDAGFVDWIMKLKSPDTEKWACETAAETVRATIDQIPDGLFRDSAQNHMRIFTFTP